MIFDEKKITKRVLAIHRTLQRRSPEASRYVHVFVLRSGQIIALRDGHPDAERMREEETWAGRFHRDVGVLTLQAAIEHAAGIVENEMLARIRAGEERA